MQRMIWRSWLAALCTVTMQGCADLSGPEPRLSPTAAPLMDWDGGPVGSYGTIEEAQAALGAAKVHWANAAVSWSGEIASAGGYMEYRGTHAEILLKLSGMGPGGSWGPAEGKVVKESGGLNASFSFFEGSGGVLRYSVIGKCGHLANANGQFTAFIKAPIPVEAVVVSEAPVNRQASASQPSCPYRDEEEYAPGGGGCDGTSCNDEFPTAEYCVVRSWYYLDTGEVFAREVLYCSNW